MFRRFLTLFAVAALTLVAASCSKQSSQTSSTATSDTAAAPTAQAPALTDGNIVAIFVAANDADIKNGQQQAKSKSKNTQVKSFADRMIQDHSQAKKDAEDLASKANITAQDNDASKQLISDTDAMRDSLGKMTGNAYDKNYIDDEVAIHQKVLSTLDTALIPNAQNPDLKALLQHARDIVQSHLEHAKTIQGQMASR